MRFQRKEKKKILKPNLIPILDAVFIFIFFLLMSAQFLEIYEIGSDAPAVQTITQEQKDKRPPLNLVLDIHFNKIIVRTGLDEKIYKTISLKEGEYDYQLLNQTLFEIKKDHLKEESIILRPKAKVEYKKIVHIMDNSREVKETKTTKATKLFQQIIFETVI